MKKLMYFALAAVLQMSLSGCTMDMVDIIGKGKEVISKKLLVVSALQNDSTACPTCSPTTDITPDTPDAPDTPDTPDVIVSMTLDSITRHGITWTFDKSYTCGQFANRDWWVVGPVTIIGIDPPSIDTGSRIMNGSMINPDASDGWRQGFDSEFRDSYNIIDAYNVARPNGNDLSESNSLVVQPGSSLISSISQLSGYDTSSHITYLTDMAVLTVLSSAPAEGSFRPPYCGDDKTIRFNKSDLNYSLLQKLEPVAETPDISTVADYFERVWFDYIAGWETEMFAPTNNMPNYGREYATQVGIASLMLHLNFPDERKETLLIRLVQLGIDNYGIVADGGLKTWVPDGGHDQGRKWPILFAGLMLNDPDMRNIGARSGDYLYTYNYPAYGPGNPPPGYIHFQEDCQTFYVTQEDVNRTNSSSWDPDSRAIAAGYIDTYQVSDIGMAEWGINHSTYPYGDNKHWLTNYRECCTASSHTGFVLAARIMGAQGLWNHDALFDYQDRYMAVTAESSSTPDWRYTTGSFIQDVWGDEPSESRLFCANMWNEYRDDF